ncbi:hypothetical protein R1sor_018840 [Riccia sorocarpa]|uniref:Ribosomal protein L18 n=1 Tax=Riccia sorocarpa TaxID=122646 RepID=A0ABD3IAZ3_9MARC
MALSMSTVLSSSVCSSLQNGIGGDSSQRLGQQLKGTLCGGVARDCMRWGDPQVLVYPRTFPKVGVARAAWTRKSKSALDPPKNKKSWKQRHEKFLKPFMLDVFISNKYVHAKVVHRVTSHVVAVATTNAKDLRFSLPSLTDDNACKTVGRLLAERAIEADVFAVKFDLRKNEKFEGKLALVVNTMAENGVVLV